MILRPYQQAALPRLRDELRAGRNPVLLVGPTGCGKTVAFCEPVRLAAARGKRVVVIADRLELVDQTSRKLTELGIDHGIVMGNHRTRDALVQVCSKDTLLRRALPPADLVVVDEAHKSLAPGFRGIVERYLAAGATVIGATATPYLLDGSGLVLYRGMVVMASHAALVAQGYLVPTRVYDPGHVAARGVHTRGGDYVAGELEALMDRPKIVGDAVETYQRLGAGRTAAVFCVTKKHARSVVDAARSAGIPTEYLDDSTPLRERRAIQRRIASGESLWAVNVGILSLGWDMPRVSYVAMLRHTQSRSLYRQQGGRGTRPWPGKTDMIIADHVGNVYRHGLLEDPEEFTLEGGLPKVAPPTVRRCLACYAVSGAGGGRCENCGGAFEVKARRLVFVKGQLEEHRRRDWAAAAPLGERARLLAKWTALGRLRNYRSGYAASIYKSQFKQWPDAGIRAQAAGIGFPLFLVRGGQACHAAAADGDSVVCACGKRLAAIPLEFKELVAAKKPEETA